MSSSFTFMGVVALFLCFSFYAECLNFRSPTSSHAQVYLAGYYRDPTERRSRMYVYKSFLPYKE